MPLGQLLRQVDWMRMRIGRVGVPATLESRAHQLAIYWQKRLDMLDIRHRAVGGPSLTHLHYIRGRCILNCSRKITQTS